MASDPRLAAPNYFADDAVAARYHRARPQYHPLVVQWIREATGQGRFARALDVGCGSGHSTVALAAIAGEVAGLDASAEMLAKAESHPHVRYHQGCAERMEFPSAAFDLITVASALHWFVQKAFYAECNRLLVPGGRLVIYNDHFTTHMIGVNACKQWLRTSFARRFPRRRGLRDFDTHAALMGGFHVARQGSFNHSVFFDNEQLTAFLMTRSNVLAAIQRGTDTAGSASAWLAQELNAILPHGAQGEFLFKCNLWLLDRPSAT